MVDPPGNEMLESRQPDCREHQGNRRGVASGDTPGDCKGAGHGRQQPQHRPNRAHQPLGKGGGGELAEQPQHSGEPGIDQARPVGVIALGRAEPRFVQVEPTMAIDETAHLDKPHGVVHVGQSQRGLCPVVRQELRNDDEPCEAQKKRDAKGDVRHRQALGQGTTCKGWDGTGVDRALAVAACISINSAQTLPPCIVPFGAIRLRGTSGTNRA